MLNMSDVGELVFVPRLFSRLRELAPGIAVRTTAHPSGDLESALESGDVDLAIGYFPMLKGAHMYQQRLFRHSFVCAVRDDHPLVGSRITRRQFQDAQHVVVEGKTNDVFEETIAANDLRRTVVLTLPHYLAIPAIVRDSDLVATAPFAIGASFAGVSGLRMMRPPIEVEMPVLRQYWHARFHRDPFNQWLRAVVADRFLDAPPRPRSLGKRS